MKSFVAFVFILTSGVMGFGAADETIDFIRFNFSKPIPFHTIVNPIGPRVSSIKIIPVNLNDDGTIQKTSFLYQGLNLLFTRSREENIISARYNDPKGWHFGHITLGPKQKFNLALDFLGGATDNFSLIDGQVVLHYEPTIATTKYLKEFFPEAAKKAALLKELLAKSQINTIIARQENPDRFQRHYNYAVSRLLKFSIFMEGLAELKSRGVFAGHNNEEKDFLDHGTFLLSGAIRAWSDLTINRLGMTRIANPGNDELVFKLGRLIDDIFPSIETNDLVFSLVKKRARRSARLFDGTTGDNARSLLKSLLSGPDLYSLLGAFMVAKADDLSDMVSGLILVAGGQLWKFRERRKEAHEYRTLLAYILDDKKTFCRISMTLP